MVGEIRDGISAYTVRLLAKMLPRFASNILAKKRMIKKYSHYFIIFFKKWWLTWFLYVALSRFDLQCSPTWWPYNSFLNVFFNIFYLFWIFCFSNVFFYIKHLSKLHEENVERLIDLYEESHRLWDISDRNYFKQV